MLFRSASKEKLFEENFPRKLYSVEKYFLDWLLPKEISAYNSYQEKLGEYFALAEGRRGKGTNQETESDMNTNRGTETETGIKNLKAK